MQKPTGLYAHITKTLLGFILFCVFTSGNVFGCTIGNCNACTTLKSKCACIAMTFFQYKPVRHHNYKDMDDYEYVHLINCDPDNPSAPAAAVPGISLDYKGVSATTQNKFYDCNFKYVRFRSCGPANAKCDKKDDIISVHIDIEENDNTVEFGYNDSAKNAGNNCPVSKKDDKKWSSYWLRFGRYSMCFDACTTDINSGYPGESETYPMGIADGSNTKLWCMVYGDLRKSGINDEYLMLVEDSGKIYTNAGVKMGTSGYCDNDVLKKYIDNKVTAPSAVLPDLGLTSSLSPMVNLKDGIKVSLPSSEQTTTEATEISCPDGQVEKNGKCVETQVCIAGQIWNPIASKCEACTSNVEWINYANESRMYCPGVMDKKLPVLQQLKKCPKGAWPNTGLTGCDCRWGTKDGDTCKNMNISASDLQYGPKGKSAPLVEQCWTKSTPATYKKCMGFDD